jgi:glutamyl-Q tRNA(Asp) synthetase
MTQMPVFRFAPSPNGRLHLGHVRSALVGYEMARRLGGRFLLRIEDIDVSRCRPEFVDGILEDLAWLGLEWEQPVLHQSRQFDVYREAITKLQAAGVLYPCFATRTELSQASRPDRETDPDGVPLYPGLYKYITAAEIERRIGSGEPFALRIDMEKALRHARAILDDAPLTFRAFDARERERVIEAHPERWGDAVIVRKDVPASYHLAVVVDDARQGVTHVTRGEDLLAATDLHRLLQILLGLPEPLYHHHPLITDTEGRKLSKSARDTGIESLRLAGVSADEVRERALHGATMADLA